MTDDNMCKSFIKKEVRGSNPISYQNFRDGSIGSLFGFCIKETSKHRSEGGSAMGGKGRKRREKNFRAAHGDNTRLPPAPKSHEIDAIPSKLRTIMQFKNAGILQQGSLRSSAEPMHRQGKGDVFDGRKMNQKDAHVSVATKLREKESDKHASLTNFIDGKTEIRNASSHDKKKKRKRKLVEDLRFEAMDQDLAAAGLKKRERKKKYLEAKKKKQKKATTDESLDFPANEKIKFGEVVEAPPKLDFPKVSKQLQDASHERLRLQAVEAYRKRRGWALRPGSHLPPINETQLS